MAEIHINVDGQIEQFHDWLVPRGQAEYDSLPDNLKPSIRSLARRPMELTDRQKLMEYYDDLEELSSDPTKGVTSADVAPYMIAITEQVKILAERQMEYVPVPERIAPHISAVFKRGLLEKNVRHETVPVLDITDPAQRWVFIFENLEAFNSLGESSAWKLAVDTYLSDAKFAARAERLPPVELDRFNKQLKNMMAVTATARAMETSTGSATKYLETLTGREKGDTSKQDSWPDFLLHADPNKLNAVINNPFVASYYRRLVRDAGIIDDANHRWRADPDDPTGKSWLPSIVEFRTGVFLQRLRKGRLVGYLKDNAEDGGFDQYIDDVLLAEDAPADILRMRNNGFEEDSRRAAAKLACDAFLVDIWTRWEDMVTEGGEKKLDLYPTRSWGGDPLKSILKPSFLPRIKKVYESTEGKMVLDWMDIAFRPEDIFTGRLENDLVTPSMVRNLKIYARLTSAIDMFMGGPMADGISSWNRDSMENLPQIVNLLKQVYGGVRVKQSDGSELLVGPHIVGAMVMRMIYCKALAAVMETPEPNLSDKLGALAYPSKGDENRPFLDVKKYLFGEKISGRSGFLRSIAQERTSIIIRGNLYDAEELYDETYDMLMANTKSRSTRNQMKTLSTAGGIIRSIWAIGDAFGGK